MAVRKYPPVIRASVVEALCPKRLNTTGKMTAILGYILGEVQTEPPMEGLAVSSDGCVTSWCEFIGNVGDLICNLRGVAAAAKLNDQQKQYFFGKAVARIEWLRGYMQRNHLTF